MLRFGVALAALSMLFVQIADAGEQYAPATLSVAQLFALTRHAAGSLPRGAYHSVERTQSAKGDVWTSESYRDGGDYQTTERIGNFVWANGSDSGRHWSEDANGLVTQSSNLFSEVDPFSVALRAPENPTGAVKLLGMTAGTLPRYVVEVTPSVGLVERRYYDAHSYLLARVERIDYDGHRQVWEYDDYRSVYGWNVAHLVRYERDGSTVTEQTQLLTYERLTSSVPSLAMPLSHPLFDLGSAASVAIPADFTQDGIFVPVIVAGRKLDFELDSGSSDLLLDPGIAKELGMETSGAYTLSFAGDINLANARAVGSRRHPIGYERGVFDGRICGGPAGEARRRVARDRFYRKRCTRGQLREESADDVSFAAGRPGGAGMVGAAAASRLWDSDAQSEL